jgi:NTE family protein
MATAAIILCMNVATVGPMRTLNLALQGGGSHGAFTWGVLDAILADSRIELEGLSGTSAGAVNAVALAGGYASGLTHGRDPREEARAALARVWGEVTAWGSLAALPAQIATVLWGGVVSPYQANPLNLNPLLTLLEREIDFDAIARGPLKVFVSATHVRTGKAVIFTGRDLGAKAVMASACLPMIFKAVEIDGEHYWDGGYSVNPAITPLIESCLCPDVLLVQINPLMRDDIPQRSSEIADRVSELTFNASLLTQMRSIDLINQLVARGALKGTSLKTVHMHRIDGGAATRAFPSSTRAQVDNAMIRELFEAGQVAARTWLERHADAIGHRGTIDIRRDYLDDTRDAVSMRHDAAGPRKSGFRPWLAQLLKRSSKHP